MCDDGVLHCLVFNVFLVSLLPGFVGGGDSFLFIYFIFFTCIGIPIYVGYFCL